MIAWTCQILLLICPVLAQEASEAQKTGTPWMGILLIQPSPDQRQAAKLPAGVGLLVSGLPAGGAGEAAKIQKGDFLVKLDDQLLINQGQLLVLLQLRKPGDRLQLEINRQGEKLIRPLTLQARLAQTVPVQSSLESTPPDHVSQEAQLNVLGQEFLLSETKGTFTLKVFEGGKSIFSGDVTSPEAQAKIQDEWQKPLKILRQTLTERQRSKTQGKTPQKVRFLPRSGQNSN